MSDNQAAKQLADEAVTAEDTAAAVANDTQEQSSQVQDAIADGVALNSVSHPVAGDIDPAALETVELEMTAEAYAKHLAGWATTENDENLQIMHDVVVKELVNRSHVFKASDVSPTDPATFGKLPTPELQTQAAAGGGTAGSVDAAPKVASNYDKC